LNRVWRLYILRELSKFRKKPTKLYKTVYSFWIFDADSIHNLVVLFKSADLFGQ
jgi:hypothetical protein